MASPTPDLLGQRAYRDHQSPTPPSKRICTSPNTNSLSSNKPVPSIESILYLPEDAVWSLRKSDLRDCFLALQQYARNPHPLTTSLASASRSNNTAHEAPTPANISTFLRLPLEIREIIYTHLLPAPSHPPIRGPHPRQLQNHISLSQTFPLPLLLLNRQVYAEALPLIYGSTTQTVHITVDYNVWVHKTRRSDLVVSSALASSIRHVHLSIHLGSEKRNNKPGDIEADARISEVRKGVKKLSKWLAGADIQCLRISWQEPPQTYTWEQKKEVLDGLRGMRALKVDAGEINWGLDWNKGRRFRFEIGYLKRLERLRQEDIAGSEN